tara:strand:+ start:2759 stop:3004 length:246 start_codon:yes stop_codon:yes gene_type:complete
MNKTELIDKLLHLGNTTEMCCSTDQHNAKELAHTLIDEYLEAINYTHSCKSDSEQLRSSCDWCNGNKRHKGDGIASITEIG